MRKLHPQTLRVACFVPSLFLCLVDPLRGAVGDELGVLTPSDSEAHKRFGWSLSAKGQMAIIGARTDDHAGAATGAAYLFDLESGDSLSKITAADARASDVFGASVVIEGSLALIGAPDAFDAEINSGVAYLFDVSDPRSPHQLHRFAPSDGEPLDFFGASVALSGNLALIGADGADAAYVFDIATGQQLKKLEVPENPRHSHLGIGHAVALSGEIALLGARCDDFRGSAYLMNARTGEQLAKLSASDLDAQDQFGASVALVDDLAVVGAPLSSEGSAYVFDISDPFDPVELHALRASDDQISDFFGYSVALESDTLVVGAPNQDGDVLKSGATYLFDARTGRQIRKLTAGDAEADDDFGWSVAIANGRALIGAPQNQGAGPYAGSAYVYLAVPEPNTTVILVVSFASLSILTLRRQNCRLSPNSDRRRIPD